MNGDLISREALKKDFEERNKACDNWIANAKDEETKIRADATKHFICEVIMTINNAPTVYPICEDKACKYRADERPKGEWNYIQAGMCVCPFCGAMPHKLYKNFCAKCGAKMGKGGAE